MLEEEGGNPKYVYLILEGSLTLFKRPESMYDKQGRQIKVHEIDLQVNPKHSGNTKVGVQMTQVNHGLVCEDAVSFGEPLSYSVKTKQQSVLFRCPFEAAKVWPAEITDNLKVYTLDKYRVFLTHV